MREEMQPQEAETQAARSIPGSDILPGAEQPPSQSVQQDDVGDFGELSAGPIDNRTHVDNEYAESHTATDKSDLAGLELEAQLEALLTKDVELSARYEVLLRNHRKTRRERRAMRAELRQLHTEEGRVLLEIKSHLARKGRGGEWAEYLRQTKPKPLSRTTADRWIKWYLDSQGQSQSEPPPGEAPENAPQNENGAFSDFDTHPPPDSGDPQQPVTTDPASANGSEAFENIKRYVLVYTTGHMTRFTASAECLVAKKGYETSHEAIYFEVTEAAARVGCVHSAAVTQEGETSNVSKGTNPGTDTTAAGSEAARKDSTLDQQ